jgi:type IV secretory pathway TrbD component
MVTRLPQDTAPPGHLESAQRETQSIPTLLHRLTHELSTLFRQEFALASAELTQKLRATLAALTVASAGGVVLILGLLVLLASAVLGLSQLMAAWLAALLVGLAVSVVGIAALVVGARSRPQSLRPRRSARSLSKDKDVLTRKTS